MQIFGRIRSILLIALLFLFPLFFLPITPEFFTTNKLYLMSFGVLTLLLLSIVEFAVTKKLVWKQGKHDFSVLFLLLAVVASIVVSSPNKIQALLNPNFGFVSLLSLVLLYFFVSRDKESVMKSSFLSLSVAIVSVLAVVFFFQPFKNLELPPILLFLKSPIFSTFGSLSDLALFLGFFFILTITSFIKKRKAPSILNTVYGILILAGLSLTVYSLVKQNPILPPYRLSWFAAVETLKNPLTAIFGVGIDNFASIFTRVKDAVYNQSPLWQVQSFAVSSSTVLHILTEAGLLGLGALLMLVLPVFTRFKQFKETSPEALFGFVFVLFAFLLSPPSYVLFFLFFLSLALLRSSILVENTLDTGKMLPLYLGVILVALGLVATGFFFLSRAYAADVYFKRSIDGRNDREVYENLRKAVITNPMIERYRARFAAIHFLLANGIASKYQQKKPPQIPKEEQERISQAIQAGINESKTVVALNPQKAANWENLGRTYRTILGVAEGADAWTISAYQRAIVLDPQNPLYRLNLGGVYYQMSNFDEAIKLFEQTIAIKPDWANAHYNLAWAHYQKGQVKKAIDFMRNALTLMEGNKNSEDYKRAQSEIEEFSKKLPAEEQATPSATPN